MNKIITDEQPAKKSIWWALCATYWYWRAGLSLWGWKGWGDAFWHGFHLRATYNDDPMLLEDNDTAREAVETDISYWEA